MPKKFKGENSKSTVARERRAAAKQEADEKKLRAEEDAYWRDDDKHVSRKQDRKVERERKKTEQVERKQAARLLLEEEEASLPTSKTSGAGKVTRAQIEATQRRPVSSGALSKGVTEDLVLEENPNQAMRQRQAEGHLDARNVDEAIMVLGEAQPEIDTHPERRQKAAYAAFEERELPRLKAENPNLRMSQLKQLLRKDWMKSMENPMNQTLASYKSKS